MFAGFFALAVAIFIKARPGNRNSSVGSRHSAFIGMIGTGFAFATFPFTGLLYPVSTTIAGNPALAISVAHTYEGPLNVYFALTASVITTYIFSALFGGFKVGVR